MTNNVAKKKTVADRQEKERHILLEVYKEMPITEIACKRAGIGRATYYRWRTENLSFAEEADAAIRLGRERITDMSESKMIAMIGKEKIAAIQTWLKHNSERYAPRPNIRTQIAQQNEEE